MTPVPRENYRIGLPKAGKLKEIFNSDLKKYAGSGSYKNKAFDAEDKNWQHRENSAEITIPPLGMIALKYAK